MRTKLAGSSIPTMAQALYLFNENKKTKLMVTLEMRVTIPKVYIRNMVALVSPDLSVVTHLSVTGKARCGNIHVRMETAEKRPVVEKLRT